VSVLLFVLPRGVQVFVAFGGSARPEKTTKHTVLAGNHWYSILFCGKLF